MKAKRFLAAAAALAVTASVMSVSAFAADTDKTVENGDFETGDLSGWTVSGAEINTEGAVIDAQTFWAEQIPYNQGGSYHFDGWAATEDEGAAYTLKSTVFTMSGSGFISFKMGGNAAVVKVYLEDGSLVGEYANTEFKDEDFPHVENGGRWATMTTFLADLHDYVGAKMYVELLDVGNPNGWGVAFFDDVVTYYETEPSLASLNDNIKVYCIGKEDEAPEGRDYTLPAVKAVNKNTNLPANPTPVKPDDGNNGNNDNNGNDGNNDNNNDNNGAGTEAPVDGKDPVNTGVEGVAVVMGVAVVAAGAVIVSKKRK